MNLNWFDAHSHWADPRLDQNRKAWIQSAVDLGLEFSLQGGVSPEDWQIQRQIALDHPNLIGLCFGLHPEWVASHTAEELELGLMSLSQQIHQAQALGETGLDLRPGFENQYELQIEAFEAQLNLAQVAGLPVVLHIVRAFDEALKVFDFCLVPSRGGLIHSFNGTWSQAQQYLDRGFHLSIGGPLLKSDNQKLFEVIRKIPMDRLLLETDLPDQAWGEFKGQLNPPHSLLTIASRVSSLRKISKEDVLLLTATNLKTLLWKS